MTSPSPLPSKFATSDLAPQKEHVSGLRGAYYWLLPLSALGLVVVMAFALPVLPVEIRIPLSALPTLVGMVVATICSVVVLWKKRAVLSGREKWAWRCITFGFFCYSAGLVVIGAISTQVQNSTALVTPADAFIIPSYPLLLTLALGPY